MSGSPEVVSALREFSRPFRNATLISWRLVDEAPRGYSKLAVFQSSDPCFLQYRGFSYLHSRLLLSQQYDIERLEAELDRIDRWEESKDDPMSRLVSRAKDDKYPDPAGFGASFAEADCTRSRPQVFTELRRKLVEYGMCQLDCSHDLHLTADR